MGMPSLRRLFKGGPCVGVGIFSYQPYTFIRQSHAETQKKPTGLPLGATATAGSKTQTVSRSPRRFRARHSQLWEPTSRPTVSAGVPSEPSCNGPGVQVRRFEGGPKPCGRGSAQAALEAAKHPASCIEHLRKGMSAATTKGPAESRRNLWASLARQAGFEDPFALEPQMIYAVMGALDLAGYRSSELYLDGAKSVHIASGLPWTQQLQQAARAAIRSCRRGRGPPKQAAGLPMERLAEVDQKAPMAPGGPEWPARASILWRHGGCCEKSRLRELESRTSLWIQKTLK